MFPFLAEALTPERVNSFTLASLRGYTGASQSGHFGQLLPFVFFAGMRQGSLGFWDFFGPIVFALAPLWIATFGNIHKWRLPAVVWCVSAIAVFYASGLPRFLLPIFPLALAFTAAGLDFSQQRGWKITNGFASGLVILLWIFGGAGLTMYSWKPVATALGIVREVNYLEERRPEYQEAEAINRVLASRNKGGRTLLFLRYMYSLDVPFLNGDPATSWMINPDRLRTPQDWKAFFQKEGITFVVRSPNYPEAIEAPLKEMEAKGDLIPMAHLVVQDFEGMRSEGKRAERPVIIFKVRSFAEQ
jgi:hypothetical protein